MNPAERFLAAMLVVFTVPWLVWRLARTDRWAPLVVVQIVAGIVLGPGVLGRASPGAYRAVFSPDVIGMLNGVAWWAVMLFVFLAGVELDLRQAWRHRRESGITAGFALGTPLLAGACAATVMLATSDAWRGPAATPAQFVAGVGMSCAVTALPILVLFLEKLGLLRRPIGQRILRYASLDDIAIWAVLALILADWARVGRQALFLAVFAGATAGARALMRRLGEADRWPTALIWLVVSALGADWSGLHYMVGAFLAGAVLDAEFFDHARLESVRQHVLALLMPVFFLSTGLRTQWGAGGAGVLLAGGLLLAASVGGKLLGVRIAGRILGWSPAESRTIGWLLQTKALIMIIFANALLDRRLITADTFTALLLMAVGSTMLTVPMVAPRGERAADARPAGSVLGAADALHGEPAAA